MKRLRQVKDKASYVKVKKGYDKAMTRLWQGYDKTMTRLWQGYDEAMMWI